MQLSYYERIGRDTLKSLVARFYEGVREDEVLRPMYEGDMDAAELRLFLFLVQYLGGPATYSERRGHPRLRMRHAKFHIDERARDHWLLRMKHAMDSVQMDTESRAFLWNYFVNTADFLRNRE
jgi:hemoglobin